MLESLLRLFKVKTSSTFESRFQLLHTHASYIYYNICICISSAGANNSVLVE
jgi:hypothetical protein